eukprot:1394392-Amorphochlora_amoeboformis.AAC.2
MKREREESTSRNPAGRGIGSTSGQRPPMGRGRGQPQGWRYQVPLASNQPQDFPAGDISHCTIVDR